MGKLDVRLQSPLRMIAGFAIRRAAWEEARDADLGLFDLAESLRSDAVVPYLRKQVEELSGGRWTIRTVASAALDRPLFGRCIFCVICSPNTPEGVVTNRQGDMFAFAIADSDVGYYPHNFKS
jgi:hypothetical protein